MSYLINREGYYVTDSERECTNCGTIFPRTSKTVTLCGACNSSRVKRRSLVSKMLSRAKARAKERGIPFNIDASDIVIPERCPILGIKLEAHSGSSGGKNPSPALDRIDNTKGYVKGNVMVVSHLANMMKSSASPEQLIKFADWIYSKFGNSAVEVASHGEHK